MSESNRKPTCEIRREKPKHYLGKYAGDETVWAKCGRVAIGLTRGGDRVCCQCSVDHPVASPLADPETPMGKIRAGIVSEGVSKLKYHALRPNGAAACSDSIPVRSDGYAADIPQDGRCRSSACRALFSLADKQGKCSS